MEDRSYRRLGAETETPSGFRAVHLDGFAIVLGYCPHDLSDAGKNDTHEAVRPGTDEDAARQAFDLTLLDDARQRPVDGSA